MSNKMAAAPPGLSSMSRKEKEVKEEKGMNSYIRKTKAFSEILSRFMNELHHVATVNCKEVWEVFSTEHIYTPSKIRVRLGRKGDWMLGCQLVMSSTVSEVECTSRAVLF